MTDFHPLVKQLLDGEITLAELPSELRAEGEEALRLLGAVDRQPVQVPRVTDRVMRAIQGRAPKRVWEIRLRVRPWLLAPALAAAAALVLWLGRTDRTVAPGENPSAAAMITVRFVLVAPDAQRVSIAGTFNGWNPQETPLVRTSSGVWATTLTLPTGQHQYAFVVDGARWVADPAAPAVDDGFGRRNSVLAL